MTNIPSKKCKTLTEQWLDAELPNGRYYVKDWDGTIHRFVAQK